MLMIIHPRRSQVLIMLHDGNDFVVGLRSPMIKPAKRLDFVNKLLSHWVQIVALAGYSKSYGIRSCAGLGEIVLTMDVWREFICLVGSGAAELPDNALCRADCRMKRALCAYPCGSLLMR